MPATEVVIKSNGLILHLGGAVTKDKVSWRPSISKGSQERTFRPVRMRKTSCSRNLFNTPAGDLSGSQSFLEERLK